MAGKGCALDSSPNSSPSDTIKHRVFSDSPRVRREVRDDSLFRTPSLTTQTKTLEFNLILIEAQVRTARALHSALRPYVATAIIYLSGHRDLEISCLEA